MKRRIVYKCFVTFFPLLMVYSLVGQTLLQYVQPLSGTASATTQAALKHSEGTEQNANTIPAVGLPFAMTQFSPQTRTTEKKCLPPYFYKDSMLTGFRGTHWLSGSCTQDYGSFTIMPIAGKLRTTVDKYALPFSHKNEYATPAAYKLDLLSENISVEISATARCGIMQFTMLQDDSLYLLIMPNSDKQKGFVKVDASKGEIWGFNPAYRIYQGIGNPAGFNGWFYIRIEKEIVRSGVFSESAIFAVDSLKNRKDMGAFAGFQMKKGDRVRVRIGTSFSSLEGAKKNVETEITSWDFDKVANAAKQKWEDALSQIKVETNVEKDKRMFYTALYHSMQHPRLFSDVDGTYPKFSGDYQLMKMKDGNYYDDFSMWDIYRAQLPLFEILRPGLINEFVQSLILKGRQGGWLPIFPCWNSYTAAMIGDHTTAFITSAYAKGINNYDVNTAYNLMRKNAFEVAGEADYKNGKGRRALNSYLKYNYIPMEDSVPIAFHKKEQVSRTLEYAYDDYALSVVAKGLNKTEDEKLLRKRGGNYQKVFDPTVGMVRGRHADGLWYEPFNADRREPYITEGTPRQYTFYAPQDIPGLAKLMGGTNKLESALDSLFVKGEYWHGNEPGHQIPFLYNYTSSPWKTQTEVRKILAEEYSDGPGGLSGNDDAGQMSAWYVFAAIGFYPVDPVSGEYLLSSALFDKIAISLSPKKTFEIICHKESPSAIYIGRAQWNGKPYNKNFILHTQIQDGGRLELWLQEKPGAWGAAIDSRPSGLGSKK